MTYSANYLRGDVSAWLVAKEADVRPTGGGIQLVSSAIDRVAETIENDEFGTYPEDTVSELADSLVPIYTGDLMDEVNALQAWHEDVEDFGPFETLIGAAQASLYVVYERLVSAALEMSDVDDEEDDAA